MKFVFFFFWYHCQNVWKTVKFSYFKIRLCNKNRSQNKLIGKLYSTLITFYKHMANNNLAYIPNNSCLLRLFHYYKGVIGIEYFSYNRQRKYFFFFFFLFSLFLLSYFFVFLFFLKSLYVS